MAAKGGGGGGGSMGGGFNFAPMPTIGYGATPETNFLDALANVPQQWEKSQQMQLETQDLQTKQAQQQLSQLSKIGRLNPQFTQNPAYQKQLEHWASKLGLPELPRTATGDIDFDRIPGSGGFADMTPEEQTAYRQADPATRNAMIPNDPTLAALPQEYSPAQITAFNNQVEKAEALLATKGGVNQFITTMHSLLPTFQKMSASNAGVTDVQYILDDAAKHPENYISNAVADAMQKVNFQGMQLKSLQAYHDALVKNMSSKLQLAVKAEGDLSNYRSQTIGVREQSVGIEQQRANTDASKAADYHVQVQADVTKARAALMEAQQKGKTLATTKADHDLDEKIKAANDVSQRLTTYVNNVMANNPDGADQLLGIGTGPNGENDPKGIFAQWQNSIDDLNTLKGMSAPLKQALNNGASKAQSAASGQAVRIGGAAGGGAMSTPGSKFNKGQVYVDGSGQRSKYLGGDPNNPSSWGAP